ncbi:MAG: hypothetical protein AAFY41_06450 [Bacteroidota bacterium]
MNYTILIYILKKMIRLGGRVKQTNLPWDNDKMIIGDQEQGGTPLESRIGAAMAKQLTTDNTKSDK